jgi:membrane fusion protein, multidrug efflux system
MLKNFFVVFTPFVFILYNCQNRQGPSIEKDTVYIQTAPLRKGVFQEIIHSSGQITASEEIKLSFKTGGIIEQIQVKEGERVSKGQLLASLKLTEIQAQTKQVELALEKAARDLGRVRNLYKDSVATLEQMQNAQTAYDIAKTNLEILRFNLENSYIKAPADGIVLKIMNDINEITAAGYPVILFGSSKHKWIVKTSVTDREIVKISPGDSAQIQIRSYADTVFQGIVVEKGSLADPYTGTYEVEIQMDDMGYEMASGFIVKNEIFSSVKNEYYIVPYKALLDPSGEKGFIYAFEQGKAVKYPVSVRDIRENAALVELNQKQIEHIVTEGAEYIYEGCEIQLSGKNARIKK